MASKKQGNARNKKRRGTAPESYSILGYSARGDITGVVLIVSAVALLLMLYSGTDALITSGIRAGLTQGFGVGAVLIPIVLILLGITFFLPSEAPISMRSAIGLSLVLLAVLGLISLSWPGAERSPALVLREPALTQAGGYVGGAIAWLLLELVGKTVSIVILVGTIISGIVICGFSISGFIVMLKEKFLESLEYRRSRKDERLREEEEAQRAEALQRTAYHTNMPAAFDDAYIEEPATTFIGQRKTTVLRRSDAPEVAANFDEVLQPLDDTGAQEVAERPVSRRLKDYVLAEDSSELVPIPEIYPEQKPDEAQIEHEQSTDDGSETELILEGASASKGAQSDASDETAGTVPDFLAPKKPAKAKKAGKAATQAAQAGAKQSNLPPLSLLYTSKATKRSGASKEDLAATAKRLQSTLAEFGLTSRVEGWVTGPSVTTFRVSMGEGERVSKIVNLQDDIALSLAAKSVRIFSPIVGTSLVGVEIPNRTTTEVLLGDVLPELKGGPLCVAFGCDSEGSPVVVDLATLPHLLVAGTTGSGKSVFLNSIVMSILMRATPEEVRFIMVDPKHVEFTFYEGLPHLYVPVVTDSRKAASALQWSVQEMERRLKIFERHRVRDIASYNKQCDAGKLDEDDGVVEHMPYFVIVIDELSDLMMVAGKDVEASIVRIAQLGRAAGIHLVVATQRPSADVVTGLIKANIDNRVALAVDNGMNSRIILDQNGAERLLGKGDMLYKLRGTKPRRAQSCYQSEAEIEAVVSFLKEHAEADYHDEILSLAPSAHAGSASSANRSDDDPLMWEAAQLVVESQLGSTSALQRHLKVGYARAGRIMDMLEQKGIVGPPDGSKPREVLLDQDGLEELRSQESAYEEV